MANPAEVRHTVERLLAQQVKDLWTCQWNTTISDSKTVRDKIIDSLTKISRNVRAGQPWHEEIDLVTL